MKKVLLFTVSQFILIFLFCSALYAQKHSVKFQFQPGLSAIENTFIVNKYNTLAGVEYAFRFSENKTTPFYLSTGVNYFNTKSFLLKNANNFGIPILLNMSMGKKFKIDLGVGINYSIMFSRKFWNSFLEENTSRDEVKANSFGLISRLGFKYRIKNQHSLGLYLSILKNYTPTHNISIIDHMGREIETRKEFINYIGISLFYELNLNKENE